MSTGLLIGHDEAIWQWLSSKDNQVFERFYRCLGIIKNDVLSGAILFNGWHGANVELSYYGEKTMTLGIVRSICTYAITEFDVARLTCVTSKRNKRLMKSLQKLGFRLEGMQRCYYGKKDCNRNTGVRFVLFREGVERLAYGRRKVEAA